MIEHSHDKGEVSKRLALRDRPNYLRDVVYGAIDGTITTFAIVAGVQGAGLPAIVVTALGTANVLADGFSMAASNYSGTKAELDERKRLIEVEHRHIRDVPEGEREELRQILSGKGLSGSVIELAVAQIVQDKQTWVEIMLTEEYGLSPTIPNPGRAALATFLAFLATGMIPLLPYIFGLPSAFEVATIVTGLVFFLIGAAKSKWSLAPWWKSGLETLLIGSVAATIAFVVGSLFRA